MATLKGNLRTHLRTVGDAERALLATRCDCSAEHLRHIGSGRKNASVRLAKALHDAAAVGDVGDVVHPLLRSLLSDRAA